MRTTSLLSQRGAERACIRLKTFVLPFVLSAAGLLLGNACTDSVKEEEVFADETENELNGEMRHDDEVLGAIFSPDGSRIVTYSKDETARLWDAFTGKPLTDPLRHEDAISGVHFSPNSKRIVSFGEDGSEQGNWVRVWDVSTGRSVGRSMSFKMFIYNVEFSPDNSMILVQGSRQGDDFTLKGIAYLVDPASGEPLGEPLLYIGQMDSSIFSPDGRRIATVGDAGVFLWSVSRSGLIGNPLELKGIGNRSVNVNQVLFSPSGGQLLGVNGEEIWTWDLADGNPDWTPLENGEEIDFDYATMDFSRDGTRICLWSWGGTEVLLWDSQGRLMGEPLVHKHISTSAEFSPDGRLLAVVYRQEINGQASEPEPNFSGEAVVWDVITCRRVGKSLRHPGVDRALFSPDSKFILTLSDNKMARLWDAKTSEPVGEPMIHRDAVANAQFSPDGSRIVTTGGNSAYLWDATTGKRIGSTD